MEKQFVLTAAQNPSVQQTGTTVKQTEATRSAFSSGTHKAEEAVLATATNHARDTRWMCSLRKVDMT